MLVALSHCPLPTGTAPSPPGPLHLTVLCGAGGVHVPSAGHWGCGWKAGERSSAAVAQNQRSFLSSVLPGHWVGNWEGTQPGQLAPHGQKDIPEQDPKLSREKEEEEEGTVSLPSQITP